jgi:hypothetical protein
MKQLFVFIILTFIPTISHAKSFRDNLKFTTYFEIEYEKPKSLGRQWSLIPVMGFKYVREKGYNTIYIAPYLKYSIDKWSIGPEISFPIYSNNNRWLRALIRADMHIPY